MKCSISQGGKKFKIAPFMQLTKKNANKIYAAMKERNNFVMGVIVKKAKKCLRHQKTT